MNAARRLFYRGFLLQALFNPKGLQRGGMRWVLGARAEGLTEEPFNANPVLAGYALGLIEGGNAPDYERHRTALGAALGGVGDRLLWGLLRPLAVVLALAASAIGPIAAAATLLAVYNPPELLFRWRAVRRGLEGLPAIQADLSRTGLIRVAPHLARLCALGVGLLAGSWLAGHVVAGRYLEAVAGTSATVGGWLILRRRSWGFWRLPLAALLLGLAWFAIEILRAVMGRGVQG
jgi:hypothetical protein